MSATSSSIGRRKIFRPVSSGFERRCRETRPCRPPSNPGESPAPDATRLLLVTDHIRNKLSQVLHRPGVYLHKDRFGSVICVGKGSATAAC